MSVDFRAHGRSGGAARGFTYAQLNDDILAVAAAAGCRRSVIAGFSGGCKNAVWFAAHHPERVRGLFLVAPPGLDVVPVSPEVVNLFVDSLERTGDLPPAFDPWFTDKIDNRRSIVIKGLAAIPRPVLEATVQLWVETSVMTQAAKIFHPTLVVAGAREAALISKSSAI